VPVRENPQRRAHRPWWRRQTTLAEALLVVGGVLSRPGRTEDGTTVCDFEPEEVKRQISVSLALAPFLFEDCKINVIDTPGTRTS